MNNTSNKTRYLYLFPVIIFSAINFLIVFPHNYSMPLSELPYITGSDDTILFDCFSFGKSTVLAVTAASACILFIYGLFKKHLKFKSSVFYIPILVYLLSVLLSYAFSPYKQFAWRGTFDRFEGTLTIISYILMLIYTMNVIRSSEDLSLILMCLAITVGIASVLGLMQSLGADPLERIPALMINNPDRQVYQTVYNPNYVSFYLTLVLIPSGYILYSIVRKCRRKLLATAAVVVFAMIIYNFVRSGSLGGFIGFAVEIVVAVIIFRKNIGRHLPYFITALVIAVFCLLCLKDTISDRLYEKLHADHWTYDKPWIDYIQTSDSSFVISLNGNEMHVAASSDSDVPYVTDSQGTPIPLEDMGYNGIYSVDDDRFRDIITVTPAIYKGNHLIILSTEDHEWPFIFTWDGVRYINQLGNPTAVDKVDHFGFKGHYDFASYRGYIWATTLPLIKDHLFTGSGADTFMLALPQDDYAVKYSANISELTVFDKAHNMYLQMLITTGLISLIAFLLLIIMYYRSCYRYIQKSDNPDDSMLIKAIVIGVTGFLITALTNDSSVSVMPVFYGLMGCSIGMMESA